VQTSLEKEVKALQVKIVDLETQSYANSPVPASTKRLESKLREVQHKLDAEIEDRNEALRQKTVWERQSRDYQAQLKDMIQQQERLVQERGAYERAIGELQQSLKKAVSVERTSS
jgi:myosin protein heavy chain